jgi:hypothetical protein
MTSLESREISARHFSVPDYGQSFHNPVRKELPTNRPVTADSGIVSVMAIFRQLSLHSPRAHATVSRFSRLCFLYDGMILFVDVTPCGTL